MLARVPVPKHSSSPSTPAQGRNSRNDLRCCDKAPRPAATKTAKTQPRVAWSTRNALKSRTLKPKRSLGQNFLQREDVLSAIVQTAELQPGDRVLEIGPGTGNLTKYLLRTGARVTAVEKDDELYRTLLQVFSEVGSRPNAMLSHLVQCNNEIDSPEAQALVCQPIPFQELESGQLRVVHSDVLDLSTAQLLEAAHDLGPEQASCRIYWCQKVDVAVLNKHSC